MKKKVLSSRVFGVDRVSSVPEAASASEEFAIYKKCCHLSVINNNLSVCEIELADEEIMKRLILSWKVCERRIAL